MGNHSTIESEVRKSMLSAVPNTTVTSLPMVKKEGLSHVGLYVCNLSTASIYFNFKGCYANTSSTAQWVSLGATCTVAGSGGASCFSDYNISALQNTISYITVERTCTSTGGVSALTMVLSIW